MKSALALNPFSPLSSNEVDMQAAVDPDVLVITPVPDDAPAAEFHHYLHGSPSATWTYRDEAGRLLGPRLPCLFLRHRPLRRPLASCHYTIPDSRENVAAACELFLLAG